MIYPNGIATTYGYDHLNRLIAVETRNLTNALLASYVYTLNSKGQRTRIVEGAGGPATRTIDYTYDAADRLIEERITDPVLGNRTISYTYDPVGNRLTKTDDGVTITYTYDDNDRLLTEGGFTYSYDNNGNMLSKTGNGETWQLAYNTLNQLVHANQNTTSVAYTYDADGIRVGKTVNGAMAGEPGRTDVTNYLVDNNVPYAQVLEEQWTRGAQSGVTRYTYGDALLAQTTSLTHPNPSQEGITQYYHYDGLNSTRGLTDATGAVTDAYAYDAYGLLLEHTGASANPYLYRGEQYDPEIDAYYLRARYYQPGIGRFLTTDSVEGMPGDPLSSHRYLYGYSNPVNNIDPSGQMNLEEVTITAGLISSLASFGVSTLSMVYEDFGDRWASISPDAGVLGFSVSGTVARVAGILNRLFPTPTFPEFCYGDMEGGVVVGGDIVFSIASGEYGYYLFGGFQGGVSASKGCYQSPAAVSFAVHHGWVWNLWNTDDYVGPFMSANVGLGPLGGFSLFKDANRSFDRGPFGMTFSALSFTWPPSSAYSLTGGYTWYPAEINGESSYEHEDDPLGMLGVALKFMAVEAGLFAFATLYEQPVGMVTSLVSVSWPTTIALTKQIWNERRPQWNMETRRDIQRNRPDDFSSGPKRWILFGG